MTNRHHGITSDGTLAVLRSLIQAVALSDSPQDARETVDRLCRTLVPGATSEQTKGLADRLYSLVDGL